MQTQLEKDVAREGQPFVKDSNRKNVAVVGLGYVGLPLALLADRKNCNVVGIDLDEDRIAKINDKKTPFTDKRVGENLNTASLKATADFAAVEAADVVVICVPTPVYEDHRPNLEPVVKACESVGAHLEKGQLVVLESTVNPGVCDEVAIPILEKKSGLRAGRDFFLAHCPERINPGDEHWNVENIPRVVGGLNKKSLTLAAEFYRSLIDAPIQEMGSLKEAEAVKIVENSFRDINIALVNELAMSFSKLGIDVVNVINGASTKPFAFMAHYPGVGVGGHCIPVDPYYLIDYAKENGFYHDFLSLARRINESMPAFTAQELVDALNEKERAIKGSEIAVLGLAYKPNIDDCRESPAFELVKLLEEKEATLRIYDPYVPGKSNVKSLREALDGAHAVVVATAHEEFKSLTPADFAKYGISVVVDGRNCLNKDELMKAGIVYRGIGR